MKRILVLAVIVLMTATVPATAQRHHCESVSGSLITNISLIPFGPVGTNLGPAFGDLAGSVAATITSTSPFTVQHYWVATNGDTINFKPALLKPTFIPGNPNAVVALWGDYRADIAGGTGKFKDATGYIEAFGLVDFDSLTTTLRYRGEVCYVDMTPSEKK